MLASGKESKKSIPSYPGPICNSKLKQMVHPHLSRGLGFSKNWAFPRIQLLQGLDFLGLMIIVDHSSSPLFPWATSVGQWECE